MGNGRSEYKNDGIVEDRNDGIMEILESRNIGIMEHWNRDVLEVDDPSLHQSITPIFHSLSHLAFENFQAFVAVHQVE